jgi:hypothetical protein
MYHTCENKPRDYLIYIVHDDDDLKQYEVEHQTTATINGKLSISTISYHYFDECPFCGKLATTEELK